MTAPLKQQPNSLNWLQPELVRRVLQECNAGYRQVNDPFFDAGNALQKPAIRLGIYNFANEEEFHKQLKVLCNIPGCQKEFETVFAYESHYNSLHRYLCSQCRKNLPSAHLLDLHISEKHDSFFAVQVQRGDKAMYACFLEECHTVSVDPQQRKDHCITVHNFPANFRFGLLPKKNSVLLKSAMEVDVSKGTVEVKSFNFGHAKQKAFLSRGDYTKALTRKQSKISTTILTDNTMVNDLMDSLPA